ncbi:AAA family ATPase [Metapseudomonas otitidis]|uniref:AAA family ATPase n=1 Tax=Metapseudomonas otitidis TaxID=319939 RepID=UPI003A843336
MNVLEKINANILASIKSSKAKKFTYIIGNNGTGKSRLLRKVVENLTHSEQNPTNKILCISNAVYDRFDFYETGGETYLGLRNVSNAIFYTNIDRQLIHLIATGIQKRDDFVETLKKHLNLEFSILIDPTTDTYKTDISSLVDKRKIRGKTIEDAMSKSAIRYISNITKKTTTLSELNKRQAAAIESFLRLNPARIKLIVRKQNEEIGFGELSSGEQNRVLLAVKIMANVEEKALIVIDEPEISLHLHWQMDFHKFLKDLLSGQRYFHAIIATHSPIIISEAAKDNKTDSIIILESENPRDTLTNIKYREGTKKDINGFDSVVLDFFNTATYNSKAVDEEIARSIVSAASMPEHGHKLDHELEALNELLSKKGIPEDTKAKIQEAVNLIKKHFKNEEIS